MNGEHPAGTLPAGTYTPITTGSSRIISGEPHLVPSVSGTTVTLTVDNFTNGYKVLIEKSSDWHPAYVALGEYSESDFPLADDISSDPNPRYKGYWIQDVDATLRRKSRANRRKQIRKDG